MDLRTDAKMDLTQALPEKFPFYHLGHVESSAPAELLSPTHVAERLRDQAFDFEDQACIAFQLQGDIRGLILVLFDQGLDFSTYTELGNILASQLATRLGNDSELEVMITPPRKLEMQQLPKLLRTAASVVCQNYSHIHRSNLIPVQTLVLVAIPEEPANA